MEGVHETLQVYTVSWQVVSQGSAPQCYSKGLHNHVNRVLCCWLSLACLCVVLQHSDREYTEKCINRTLMELWPMWSRCSQWCSDWSLYVACLLCHSLWRSGERPELFICGMCVRYVLSLACARLVDNLMWMCLYNQVVSPVDMWINIYESSLFIT